MSEQKFRIESDLLGELKVPADVLYGVQTPSTDSGTTTSPST